MYIELIDLLRCPRPHEESWLVAAFNRMEGRFVIDGRLGCPVCAATYAIADGIADLREAFESLRSTGPGGRANDEHQDAAMRAAAMLGLTRPGSVAVLEGLDGRIAPLVSQIASCQVISLNPAGESAEAENVATVRAGSRLPLGTASIDGMMMSTGSTQRDIADIGRVLKSGGRLVVPADWPITGNFSELARDERYVVAEAAGPLLNLSR